MRRFTRGAVASGAVTMFGVALGTVAPVASSACDGHECDKHLADWGCLASTVAPSDACCEQGHMLDENHWESTLQNADWLPFQSYEMLSLHYGAFTGAREPDQALSFIFIAPAPPEGPDAPFPDAPLPEGGFDPTTLASGNDGEWDHMGPRDAVVENATCAATVVRVVIGFPEIEGGVPPGFIGPCQRHETTAPDASRRSGG